MEYLLTFITFVPLVGVLLILLIPSEEERTIKNMAIGISVVPLLLAILLWFAYDKGGGRLPVRGRWPSWIPAINVNYHVGVDGLSIPLIFLTALLTTLGLIYSSFTIKHAGQRVLYALPAAGDGHVRRLYLAGPGAVLRLLGDRPGAHVPAHRHLGPGQRTGPSTRPSSSSSTP